MNTYENGIYGSYENRCNEIVDFFADRGPEGYLDRVEFIEVAARLYRGRDIETALTWLDDLLASPHGDMFWMYPMVYTAYAGRDHLPEEVKTRMAETWSTYTPYRGDTENHWLIYYSSLYLAVQMYGKDPGMKWFNGKTAEENLSESVDYIYSWMDLTVTEGQGEFDSPHYIPFFITPMALLFAYAEDQTLKTRAGMMLDYIIADFAVDQLNGEYAGGFSRIYPEPTLERWRNGSTTYAWLLFGNTPFAPDAINVILPRAGYRPHGTALMLATSGYKPPEAIVRLANDTDRAYFQLERKRTRHRMRYSNVRNEKVYKSMFRCADYAVGSIQGGFLQPIQQHTWDVLWATENPKEGFNTLFTIHPCSSGTELAMYFSEEPDLLTRGVVSGEKGTYDLPEKWTGASPCEQVYQYQDTVIVLYEIPEGTRFPHVSGYFSRTLKEVTEHDSGWIFARAGRAYLAYYPLAKYTWVDEPGGDKRLFSEELENGAILQMAQGIEYPDLDHFASAILGLELSVDRTAGMVVRFQSLRGPVLVCAYGETPMVDGVPVDYENWPLFAGPFLNSVNGSRRMEIQHGDARHTLDFNF